MNYNYGIRENMTTKATQTKPPKDLKHIDRLKYAAELVKGKRVLDIGGQKMLGAKGHFVVEYNKIHLASEEYRIVIRTVKGISQMRLSG